MPVVPANRGATAPKPKAPWAKDSSAGNTSMKPSDIPWRKNSSTSQKPDEPQNVPQPSSSKSTTDGRPKTVGLVQHDNSENKPPTTKNLVSQTLPKVTNAPKHVKEGQSAGANKPPPAPPAPPPPPPSFDKLPPVVPGATKTPAKLARLEQLKKVPRRRPDWSVMMKEIEQGRKLNHVECNDRSKPIIPRMKSLGKFVFDSEAKPASKTDAIHNKLLTEIQSGVKLKKVQCNDRSKPLLGGLRKFRRQLTIEEQLQRVEGGKEVSIDVPPPELLDDADDIDALRDDLQSAKQMLELEIEAKGKLGKENRDLQCQIIAIEAENEKLKAQLGLIPESQVSALVRRESRAFKDLKKSRSGLYKSSSGIKKSKSGFGDLKANKAAREEDSLGELNELEEEVNALKGQVACIRNSADEWEAKFREVSQKLLLAQGNLEDSEQKRVMLEKKLELMQTRKGVSAVVTVEKCVQTEDQVCPQSRRVSRQSSTGKGSESYSSVHSGSESDENSDLELDDATILKKKQERELKLWENKLRSIREKQNACKTERRNLKAEQKRLEQELKGSKSRLKDLQKEVDKMATILKNDETTESEKEAETDEEDEEESEEESESSEEESATESEDSSDSTPDGEATAHEEQLNILTNHVKRGENILNALRKGNYLLRANIDHLKDDLEVARIKYHDLEHELNIVLADV